MSSSSSSSRSRSRNPPRNRDEEQQILNISASVEDPSPSSPTATPQTSTITASTSVPASSSQQADLTAIWTYIREHERRTTDVLEAIMQRLESVASQTSNLLPTQAQPGTHDRSTGSVSAPTTGVHAAEQLAPSSETQSATGLAQAGPTWTTTPERTDNIRITPIGGQPLLANQTTTSTTTAGDLTTTMATTEETSLRAKSTPADHTSTSIPATEQHTSALPPYRGNAATLWAQCARSHNEFEKWSRPQFRSRFAKTRTNFYTR